MPLNQDEHPFEFASIYFEKVDGEGNPLGGNDQIQGNDGDDIILGQQGDDWIEGNEGNDSLIGGHNVTGGHDGNDRVDGGAGNDVVVGDNAIVLNTGKSNSPRHRMLSDSTIYLSLIHISEPTRPY